MDTSAQLFEFLRWWEQGPELGGRPALVAYDDGGGVYTLGWGHTHGVREGDTCDEDQAAAWLVEDVAACGAAIARKVAVPLTQQQFDALEAFLLNVGWDKLDSPKAPGLRRACQTSADAIATQMTRWIYSGGQISHGLVRRRDAEQRIWNFGDYGVRP